MLLSMAQSLYHIHTSAFNRGSMFSTKFITIRMKLTTFGLSWTEFGLCD